MIKQTITGQVRLRRKLCKSLFFIDIQPSVETDPKSQVFFRTDDGSLDIVAFQESFRACRPGSVISVKVSEPTDPTEQQDKSYPVWQCNQPVDVVIPYTSRNAFIQDRALGGSSISTQHLESEQQEETLPLTVADNTNSAPCKYWINKNKCERGEECSFQHPTGDAFEQARVKWLEEVTKQLFQQEYSIIFN